METIDTLSYTIKNVFHDTKSMKRGWRIFVGQTRPQNSNTSRENDVYMIRNNMTRSSTSRTNVPLPIQHIDVSTGIQSYVAGAINVNELLVDDDDGFVLKTKVFNDVTDNMLRLATLRLEGMDVFNGGMFIVDARQIPSGCGVSPSFQLVGTPDVDTWKDSNNHVFNNIWPLKGSIDLIHQVNNRPYNATKIHTATPCEVNIVHGTNFGEECSHGDAFLGCSSHFDTGGQTMNKNGSVFVFEWVVSTHETDGYVRTWRFDPNNIPENLQNTMSMKCTLDRSQLRDPDTEIKLNDRDCPGSPIKDQHLVINMTICDDWANAMQCKKHGPYDIDLEAFGNQGTSCFDRIQQKMNEMVNSDGGTDPDHPSLLAYQWILNSIITLVPIVSPECHTKKEKTPINDVAYMYISIMVMLLIIVVIMVYLMICANNLMTKHKDV